MRTSRPLKPSTHPVRVFLLLTQPSVILLCVIVILLQWRIPTFVQLDITIPLSEWNAEKTELLEIGRLYVLTGRHGEIHYPELQTLPPVKLPPLVQIELKPLEHVRIEQLAWDEDLQEGRFRLMGLTERLQTIIEGQTRDYRLTKFDVYIHSRMTVFLGITTWIGFTAIGWYKVYQELKR